MNKILADIWEFDDSKFPTKESISAKIRFLLKYAILAPSSHNMQAWKFRILGNTLFLQLNENRKLLFSDRSNRQAYISLGCSLANLLLASEHFNLPYKVEFFPEEIDDDVVKVTFGKSGEHSAPKKYRELFGQIKLRNTNRFPHLQKQIPLKVLEKVNDISRDFRVNTQIVYSKRNIQEFARIVSGASFEAFSNKTFKEELSNWVISVYSKRKNGIPLYDFGIPHLLTIFAAELIKLVPAGQQRDIDYKNISNSTSVIVISNITDFKEDWINVGVGLEITWLYLTSQGLSLSPMAAAIEHPESRVKLQKSLSINGYPMFFARLGYSSKPSRHSPRNSVEEVIAN